MANEPHAESKHAEAASEGEKKLAKGSAMAASVATDLLAVVDQASGLVVGGTAGLVSGMVRGLGEGFDVGRAKGGLVGGVVGMPLAAVSQGLHGLTSGMSKGLERGVSDMFGAFKGP